MPTVQNLPINFSRVEVLRILRGKASRYALYGTVIALCAVILGTLLVAQQIYGQVTIDTIIRAHGENIALKVLDAMPFIFAAWGQYASFRMAREAGQMVDSGTQSLREALEEAQMSAHSRTEFFARMSHELRTPINAIMGMSKMLLDERLEGAQHRYASVIRDSAEGLLTIINDVLDMSKLEAGHLELDSVEFNLHDCINNVVALLKHLAEQKEIGLRALIAPDVPRWVTGDPGRLRQVLINLVGNAIKFTREGEVMVGVSDWERTQDGRYRLRLEVADTGVGIDKADQVILFQPYQQARDPKLRQPGTGLGLSISRQLVEAMGGHIGVESEPGIGSRFWFTALLGIAQVVDISKLARRINLRGARALLAETPSASRAAMVDQLHLMGLDVEVVDSGRDALAAARQAAGRGQGFDIVMLDMFLPDVSGEEVGAQLKALPETRGVSLVAMTSAGTRGDAKRLNDVGFTGYLTRPISFEDLPDILAAVLAMQAMPEAQRQQQGMVTRHYVNEHRRLGGRVLLVEDSEVNAEVAKSMLGRMGCEVEHVASGADAVDALADGEFAAVLLDYRLPDADGGEVLIRIREMPPPRGRVPVLIFSAGLSEAERQLCATAGADDFLDKPIRPEELQTALERYLPLAKPAPAVRPVRSGPVADAGLIRIFIREATGRMDEIRFALRSARPDFEAVARHAHTLKGTSRHLGDTGLPDLARKLEQAAEHKNRRDAAATFDAIEKVWQELVAVLKRQLASTGADGSGEEQAAKRQAAPGAGDRR